MGIDLIYSDKNSVRQLLLQSSIYLLQIVIGDNKGLAVNIVVGPMTLLFSEKFYRCLIIQS